MSQWGAGVHQCVAAWEKHLQIKNGETPTIKIPSLSSVVSEGDVSQYLRDNFEERYGYTGTFGSAVEQSEQERLLGVTAASVIMPRAKRNTPLPDVAWPIIDGKERYNRSYHFPVRVLANKQDQFKELFYAIENAQTEQASTIIFFNTIEECEEFSKFLLANAISNRNIQILDDTNPADETGSVNPAKLFHPSEAAVIKRAHAPGMITLATAAGGRGTDFKGITYNIDAKPSLKRVEIQKAGRTGRNGELGVGIAILNAEDLDLDLTKPAEVKDYAVNLILGNLDRAIEAYADPSINDQKADFRFQVHPWQEANQAVDLKKIRDQDVFRFVKNKLQSEFYNHLMSLDAKSTDKASLQNKWIMFFNELNKNWNKELDPKQNLDAIALLINKHFQDQWQITASETWQKFSQAVTVYAGSLTQVHLDASVHSTVDTALVDGLKKLSNHYRDLITKEMAKPEAKRNEKLIENIRLKADKAADMVDGYHNPLLSSEFKLKLIAEYQASTKTSWEKKHIPAIIGALIVGVLAATIIITAIYCPPAAIIASIGLAKLIGISAAGLTLGAATGELTGRFFAKKPDLTIAKPLLKEMKKNLKAPDINPSPKKR